MIRFIKVMGFTFLLFGAPLAIKFANAGNDTSKVVDTNLIDKTTSPCEDFFQYSCGQWLKKTEIPGDRSKIYRFSEIDIQTEKLLSSILEKYKKGEYVPKQKNAPKLGAFYASCMNEKATNKSGKLGVKNLFARIETLREKNCAKKGAALASLVADLHQMGIPVFFNFYVDQDPGDARQIIPQFDQGGLGLPEKGYYLDETADMKKTRQKYLSHINKMAKISKFEKVVDADLIKNIFTIETELAKGSMSPIERRDPKAIYHKMTLKDFKLIMPQFDWSTYFTKMGLKEELSLNVTVPNFFSSLGKVLENHSEAEIENYLKWQALHSVAEYASHELISENFNFYGKFLNGQKELRPRWKECVSSIDSYLGEALGESFVEVAFGSDSKKLASQMTDQIQDEVRHMFSQLDWMDRHTSEGALKKLNSLVKKIGYPEPSRNYDEYTVTSESWFENIVNGNRFESQRRLAKIGKPVDRSEWGMTASTNNAYYNPTMNEIVFPAGILQEPLFSINADLAANYGATGATVGHEISHGFDDEGRQFDENGNLNNWWSENSTNLFNSKAQCLAKQYDEYVVADGVHVKGELTLGENIADLGGLKIALKAYQRALGVQPKSEELQRFFVAYAQSWCGKATPEYEKNIVQVDPHSPARFRVNGVVVNLPEFSEAFSCKEGQQAMAPKNRCQVW